MESHVREGPLVSIIVPCHNASRWLNECLVGIAAQSYRPLELSLWDDASTDDSAAILGQQQGSLEAAGVKVILGGSGFGGACSSTSGPIGCGAAKNRAVAQSSGEYLCFQDADDVMMPGRVAAQLALALQRGTRCLIGSGFVRDPPSAQPRYSAWLNSLSDEGLWLQRFRECPLAMPTWFCGREVFHTVGGFLETGPGTPEDLDFLYRHVRLGGTLARVTEPLVMYRYHEHQQSHGVSADAIWALRLEEMETSLLSTLERFSIWGAGRDGKRFYKSLSEETRRKVVAFLDIDPGKLAAGHYFDKQHRERVPIVEWTKACEAAYQPTIICVKSGLHDGFDENLGSLKLQEGRDFWRFN